MKTLSRLLMGLFILSSSLAHATQISMWGQCLPVGGWDTLANLNSTVPASMWYPCTYAWTADKGPVFDDGSVWQPISSYTPAPTVGTPNTLSLSFATAFQATNTLKPDLVTINVTSTAALSLSGGTTNSASVVIGPTSAVASGTGTVIDLYSNSNTGTLTIGLGLSTISAVPLSFTLPTGWFYAIRQTSGTVTITSAFDQSLG